MDGSGWSEEMDYRSYLYGVTVPVLGHNVKRRMALLPEKERIVELRVDPEFNGAVIFLEACNGYLEVAGVG